MALFFNFPTKADSKAGVLHSKWHTQHPLLAVATSSAADPGGGDEAAAPTQGPARLTVFNEEGDRVGTPEARAAACSSMAWHPRLRVLCSGWRDGAIYLWSQESSAPGTSRELQNSPHIQKGMDKQPPISCVCWTSNGDKVITCDRAGVWVVWRFDAAKCTLTQVVSNKENALDGGNTAITHATFRTRARDRQAAAAAEADEGGDKETMAKLAVQDEEGEGLEAYAQALGGAFVVTRFQEDCTWYLGTQKGSVHGVDDEGQCATIFNMDQEPIIGLLFHFARTGLVAMNAASSVAYYTMMDDHRWMQQMKFKVSFGRGAEPSQTQMIWIGNGIIGTCAHESVIRCWNIEANEMYVIQMESPESESGVRAPAEKIMCIGYNTRKRVLCGGTREKRVVFWQYCGGEVSKSEEDWEPFAEINLEAPVSEIAWGPGEDLLSVSMPDSVSVLHETALKRRMSQGLVVVQLMPDTVHFEDLGNKIVTTAKSKLRIKGVDLAGHTFVVWNSKELQLFEIQATQGTVSPVNYVNVETSGGDKAIHKILGVAQHSKKVFVARGIEGVSRGEGLGTIDVYNLQLARTQHLTITANEGVPQQLSVNGDYLVAATNKNYVRCWWIGDTQNKVHHQAKMIMAEKERIEITDIAVNCKGEKVAILARKKDDAGHTTADSRLHVYDMQHDRTRTHDFADVGRFPVSVVWDETERRLLSCETRRLRQHDAGEGAGDEEVEPSRITITSLFDSDKGLKQQEQFPLEKNMTALVGMSVPNFFIYCRDAMPRAEGQPATHVVARRMRDFEGIDCDADPKTKEAMLKFSYHLACGDMDAAYRAVKLIRDENVWTNLAHMCVKTRRLDVAEVCLGNMQDAKGARALREARKEPEVDAHVAMLAIQLGLNDEAEKLYKKCGRFDLLQQLYQAQNRWDQAVKVAEEHDRIHLRTVHYCHARHLESLGQIDDAIKAYELAKCQGYEVPRMLFDLNMIDELERYVGKAQDKDVYMWWAQFCESNQQYETALHYYREAGDMLNLVRLYCFLDDFGLASHIIEENIERPEFQLQTRAAAFHLARQYEERQSSTRETLHFFRVAKAFKNAIRIARSSDLDTEVMQLSLQADTATIIESAQWFEEQKMLDKAVTLYQKGGELSKAIELCVHGELFDVLQKLADTLDKNTDPDVFVQCANFFKSKGQYEKAAAMFIQAKSYDSALQLCIDHNVKLTEEMAEEMTLPKTENEDDEVIRNNLLRKIAKVAKLQESWHLACKKYTQAGDRLKGMKVLLKSGDTERIIFFTNHSRQKDIYIVAANYLQTLEWHNQPNLVKNIITFYQKARAWESLAGFYDAMAQVDIDEFRDYEKALGGLREAYKYLDKSKVQSRDQKMEAMQLRIKHVEQFVEARNLVKVNPEKMVQLCEQLLQVDDLEGAVRVGDVYALLVEFYTQQSRHDRAYELIEKMRDRGIVLSYYLEMQLIQSVYQAMGVVYQEQEAPAAQGAGQPEDAVDEDIPDDAQDDD